MDSTPSATIDCNQELLEDAVRFTPHRARVLTAPTFAVREEEAAYEVYTTRSSCLSLGDDERSRSREHTHWLKAAQYRWLELAPRLRSLAYSNVNFHRFLAFNFLKLSDLRWLVTALKTENPTALQEVEWQMIHDLLDDIRGSLLRTERAAFLINEADILAGFSAIEHTLAQCQT